ncbi:hypothetical protein B0H10DRAFT_1960764 [Mycena sp. CBHHK59/15]|nr:hypothetical protein B0H10DRAFT_1960764 [Mycena sp. CBHHK59/15]
MSNSAVLNLTHAIAWNRCRIHPQIKLQSNFKRWAIHSESAKAWHLNPTIDPTGSREKKRKRPVPKVEKHVITPPPTVLATRHVNINGNKKILVQEKLVGVTSQDSVATPVARSETEAQVPVDVNDDSGTPESEAPETQTARLMAEYGDKFPDIIRLWTAHKSGARVGSPCYCGQGVRSTQCHDCRQYDLSCEACWIKNHENNPFHWAYIWKHDLGFFVKHDLSAVNGGGHAATLGHYGKTCPNAGNSQMMTMFDQLMEAGFFPGSMDTPRTAFAFDVLRRFHLASLESKTAALDYISCLRRLTDNATTATMPDPFPAFLPASRMYRYLKTIVRLGQAHGIDGLTPYRPAEDLVVHCPVCPEIGVNLPVIPPNLLYTSGESSDCIKHILQQQLTLDGNFHTGHFAKNCDPNDISLCNGKAQFPPIRSIPPLSFTLFSPPAFRFANADAALARMLRKMDPGKSADVNLRLAFESIDQVLTYNIACEYFVHVKTRFRQSPDLADVADIVDRIRWGIPALHVTGHKGDYVSLYNDLLSVKKLFLEKRKLFIGISLSHLDTIVEWQAMARQTKKGTGGVTSVYRHTTSKVPSQTAIYQHMIANLANFASTQIPTNRVAFFLNEGMKIQDNQRKVKNACARAAEHDLQETQKEITIRRTKLTMQLGKWHKIRDSIVVMPEAAELIAAPQACEVEHEMLWLPSDFSVAQRVAMGVDMIALAEEEAKLREGEAYSLIRCLQTACKGLSALEDRKRLEIGQKGHTTAGEQVLDARRRHDNFINAYNSVWKAMLSLGTVVDDGDENSQFLPLALKDTFMKSRRRERALGDSRRGDGVLYTRIGVAAGSKISNAPEVEPDESPYEDDSDEPKSKRSRPGPGGGVKMTQQARQRAKETAHMWKRLAEQCRAHLTLAGYKFALESDFNLIAYIEQERGKSDNLLREQGIGTSMRRRRPLLSSGVSE